MGKIKKFNEYKKINESHISDDSEMYENQEPIRFTENDLDKMVEDGQFYWNGFWGNSVTIHKDDETEKEVGKWEREYETVTEDGETGEVMTTDGLLYVKDKEFDKWLIDNSYRDNEYAINFMKTYSDDSEEVGGEESSNFGLGKWAVDESEEDLEEDDSCLNDDTEVVNSWHETLGDDTYDAWSEDALNNMKYLREQDGMSWYMVTTTTGKVREGCWADVFGFYFSERYDDEMGGENISDDSEQYETIPSEIEEEECSSVHVKKFGEYEENEEGCSSKEYEEDEEDIKPLPRALNPVKKRIDTINALIGSAYDKDGDPVEVVDSSSTWEEPMVYDPIGLENNIVTITYNEPLKSNRGPQIEVYDLDSYLANPDENWFILDDLKSELSYISRMYKKAVKKAVKEGSMEEHVSEEEEWNREDISHMIDAEPSDLEDSSSLGDMADSLIEDQEKYESTLYDAENIFDEYLEDGGYDKFAEEMTMRLPFDNVKAVEAVDVIHADIMKYIDSHLGNYDEEYYEFDYEIMSTILKDMIKEKIAKNTPRNESNNVIKFDDFNSEEK